MKYIAVIWLVSLLIMVSSSNASEAFPDVESQVKVLCKGHQKPTECRALSKAMLAAAYRTGPAAMACTDNPRLPYCEQIFKDATILDKWGK